MIFNYYKSNKKIIGLISIPHSGLFVPNEFKKYLISDIEKLNTDIDYNVDNLIDIDELNYNGIDVIVSNINRVCIDLNRDINNCLLYWNENTKGDKLVIDEPKNKKNLIDRYYLPYFNKIYDIYNKVNYKTSIIDLHSMPSKATTYHLLKNNNQNINRPDFCLSDINGKTCSYDFIHNINLDFIKNGFKPNINNPYIGGHLTKFFNDNFNVNNIQIEINRILYMNENNKQMKDISFLKKILTIIIIKNFIYTI